jgi:hypothetical protein
MLINIEEPAETPHQLKKALRVALASMKKERQSLAVDCNLRRKYKATFNRARYADNRTKDLDKAKEILQTIYDSLS